MVVFSGSQKVAPPGEVGGIDDEGLSLPSTSRVAAPLTDALGKMRTPTEGNYASLVDRLQKKHHVSGGLQNLVITQRTGAVGVVHAKPWHSVGDATQRTAEILRARRRVLPCRGWRGGVRVSLTRLRGHRRNSPIRRIHNQGSSIVKLSFDHLAGSAGRVWVLVAFAVRENGLKEIVSAGEVTVCVHVEEPGRPLLELSHFLVCQKRLPFQRFRRFQWGRAVVQPDSLKVAL